MRSCFLFAVVLVLGSRGVDAITLFTSDDVVSNVVRAVDSNGAVFEAPEQLEVDLANTDGAFTKKARVSEVVLTAGPGLDEVNLSTAPEVRTTVFWKGGKNVPLFRSMLSSGSSRGQKKRAVTIIVLPDAGPIVECKYFYSALRLTRGGPKCTILGRTALSLLAKTCPRTTHPSPKTWGWGASFSDMSPASLALAVDLAC